MKIRNFAARAEANYRSACAMAAHYEQSHRRRLRAFIDRMARKLVCQECSGAGGHVEPVLDCGQGPFFECGWCEGIGFVTPHRRGLWLKMKRDERVLR